MHQSPDLWWYHRQFKESTQRLHELLGMLIQEAEQCTLESRLDTEKYLIALHSMLSNHDSNDPNRLGKFEWE